MRQNRKSTADFGFADEFRNTTTKTSHMKENTGKLILLKFKTSLPKTL